MDLILHCRPPDIVLTFVKTAPAKLLRERWNLSLKWRKNYALNDHMDHGIIVWAHNFIFIGVDNIMAVKFKAGLKLIITLADTDNTGNKLKVR